MMEANDGINYNEMLNYFHTRLRNVVLFQGWRTYNAPDLALACLFAFVVAIIFEVVQSMKECHANKRYKSENEEQTERLKNETKDDGEVERTETKPTRTCWSPFTKFNLIQTLLYTIHGSLSMFIMFIYMTFNVYLCLAVMLGKAVGYFFLNGTNFD